MNGDDDDEAEAQAESGAQTTAVDIEQLRKEILQVIELLADKPNQRRRDGFIAALLLLLCADW